MEKKSGLRKGMDKITGLISSRNMAIPVITVFVLSLLPVLYLTFVNRATGDDFGYAVYTRAAWLKSHSLLMMWKASLRTIRVSYFSWQGTWFSILLFTLQPEVFSEKAYLIVTPLILFFWIGSTFYLFKELLVRYGKTDIWSYRLITVLFLGISIHFIPTTRPALYWYNGCMHYMVPFAMCQMTAAWILKYVNNYKKSLFAGITVFMTLLGGSNYQAALFVLIFAGFTILTVLLLKREKRILFLLLPILLELAGLLVSMKAPGNKVRGGEDFGFSLSRGIKTIVGSFLYGIRDIGTYFQERPLIFAGLLLLFCILVFAFLNNGDMVRFRHPVPVLLMVFCLYSAMQAPALYAGVEVSGGVYNTNYQVFLLSALVFLWVTAGAAAGLLRNRQEKTGDALSKGIVLAGLILSAVFLVFVKGSLKGSTFYKCLVYITSGQASDYREQMELQTRLLKDETVEEVVVPSINDEQGPLMNMTITGDKDAWSNTVTREFYGKKSLVAIDRSEWMELYGKSADEK